MGRKGNANGLLWLIAAIAGLVSISMAAVAIITLNIAVTVGMLAPLNLRITEIATDQHDASLRWEKSADHWRAEREKINDWIGEHDRRIEARDASQWERIKSVERETRGVAEPITIAPGEEP